MSTNTTNGKVVGLSGLKGSGEDTVADHIVEKHGFDKKALADPLKEAAKKMFVLDDEQLYGDKKEEVDERWGVSPREILQRLGTDFARDIHENVWIENMRYRLSGAGDVVVSDIRFVNEANFIREMGGKVLGIDRPGCVPDNHKSEREMFFHWYDIADVTISNSSDIATLHALVDKFMESHYDC